MSKVLKCADVAPGCDVEIRGESEDDVLQKAAEHAREEHNIDGISDEMLSKIKGAIRDEGEAKTRRASSAN